MGIQCEDKIYDNKNSLIELFLSNNDHIVELNLGDNYIDEYGLIDLFSVLNSTQIHCNL